MSIDTVRHAIGPTILLFSGHYFDFGDPDAILCPAQTGATDCCATCVLCWQSERSIAFRPH